MGSALGLLGTQADWRARHGVKKPGHFGEVDARPATSEAFGADGLQVVIYG